MSSICCINEIKVNAPFLILDQAFKSITYDICYADAIFLPRQGPENWLLLLERFMVFGQWAGPSLPLLFSCMNYEFRVEKSPGKEINLHGVLFFCDIVINTFLSYPKISCAVIGLVKLWNNDRYFQNGR